VAYNKEKGAAKLVSLQKVETTNQVNKQMTNF